MYDLIIVGAGPAGIFTALELVKKGSKDKILIIEKGRSVEKRVCPKSKTKQCVNCKPYCNITTGFSGAGAFSDGKLSLSPEVGGDLPELIGTEMAEELIKYADSLYLEFGADSKVEGVGNTEKVKDIRKKAIQAGLKLVDCPIRHLGTEKAQEIYYKIEQYLLNNGVEIKFNVNVEDIMSKITELNIYGKYIDTFNEEEEGFVEEMTKETNSVSNDAMNLLEEVKSLTSDIDATLGELEETNKTFDFNSYEPEEIIVNGRNFSVSKENNIYIANIDGFSILGNNTITIENII